MHLRVQAISQLHALGYALRRQGRFREAALEYSKVLALDPRHFKTYFNRGFTFDKVGRGQRQEESRAERKRERECVCVWCEGKRDGQFERERERVCVCVCVRV
jgi:hypothetical protein